MEEKFFVWSKITSYVQDGGSMSKTLAFSKKVVFFFLQWVCIFISDMYREYFKNGGSIQNGGSNLDFLA
jgi:hypothetical protein